MATSARSLALALVALLASCDDGRGPRLMMSGDGFFDSPWPSDLRTVDGRPDLAGFPGRDEYELLQLYADDIETLDGFATNGPVWLRFDGDLDTAALPEGAATATLDSPILLVDVDPDSLGRGGLVPWTWAWQDTATSFQPEDLLAIQPVWGFPLHPGRTYAVVVTTDIARPAKAMEGVFEPDHPQYAHYASLGETLFQLGIDPERVAGATVFTTQDPVRDLAVYVDHVRSAVSLPALDQELVPAYSGSWFQAWEGQLWLPLWQHGTKPYTSEGGGFQLDDDGVPVLATWERGAFTISVPKNEEMPDAGWPVVFYLHGTGGDHTTFANSSSQLEPAAVLARRGIAGIGISLPLHGERSTGGNPELLSFNYFNPTAARGNFRQAVLDAIYMIELLTTRQHSFLLPDDDGGPPTTMRLDPDRVVYMGHSHGGIVGAMAAPWLGSRVPAVFLSGAGAGLSLSVEYRKEGGLDIQELISNTFALTADEAVVATHPLVGMVQTLGEAVDPINYAPYWHHRQPFWDNVPANVLMTSGLLDGNTPAITAEVMAGAAGIPILDPVAETQPVNELTGMVGQDVPTSLNLLAWDGTPVSGGLAQYPDSGHFPIFEDGDAARLYADFLESALNGDAPLIDFEVD